MKEMYKMNLYFATIMEQVQSFKGEGEGSEVV